MDYLQEQKTRDKGQSIELLRLKLATPVTGEEEVYDALNAVWPDSDIDWRIEAGNVLVLEGHPDQLHMVEESIDMFTHHLRRVGLSTS